MRVRTHTHLLYLYNYTYINSFYLYVFAFCIYARIPTKPQVQPEGHCCSLLFAILTCYGVTKIINQGDWQCAGLASRTCLFKCVHVLQHTFGALMCQMHLKSPLSLGRILKEVES